MDQRQTLNGVSVVAGWAFKIIAANFAFISIAHTINDRGISLQWHAYLQTAHKYTCNFIALTFMSRFLLHATILWLSRP